MTKTSTYPLRLPVSLKIALEKLSKQDSTSMNQFVMTAVAEKISALNTATFFDERRGKGESPGISPDSEPEGRRTASAGR
jgi:hypothetical protein